MDPNVSPAQDARFRVLPGLAGGAGHVSFESVNYPGYYLRHYGFDFVLAANDGGSVFAADATFRQVAGLGNSSWSSFQSYNYPDRHIRHYAYQLRLDPINDAQARNDATFRLTS
ncbi:AbfB domain-containing protein [Micromonospora tarapacensis]|uniref:AbfB domain-containing protein n=1 Tax=Micromonospora tarapacensis TaxID=2835305 RepID=UPI002F3FF103